MSILIFSSSMLVTHNTRRSRILADSQAAILVERSAVACAVGQLQEALEDPKSRLNALLTSERLEPGTRLDLDTTLLKSILAEYRDAEVSVKAVLEKIIPLDQERLGKKTGGADPVERRCILRLNVSGQVGKTPIEHEELREFRVVNLLPGILGKFTLFIREAGRSAEMYNLFANEINGWADDRIPPAERFLPIVLQNGGLLDEGMSDGSDSDEWKRRGFVFLGGGQVVLNLTAGNDPDFGECFHFFHLSQDAGQPGYFDPHPTSFFAQPPEFSMRHQQTENTGTAFSPGFAYSLKRVVSGYYTADADLNGMNPDSRLRVTFPGLGRPIDPRMRSSILHLYGTRQNPSPTLVLGNVHRRYADYGAIVLEATGNTVRDAILAPLPEVTAGIEDLPPIPGEIAAVGRGDLPEGTRIRIDASEITWHRMFGSSSSYRELMSRGVEEPYLRSHDFLYHRTGTGFHPERSTFGEGAARPQHRAHVAFHESLGRREPMYDDGLPAALPDDFLLGKAVYRVADERELLERFLDREGRLELDTAVIVTGSPSATIALPQDLIVSKGGILLVEQGNLLVAGVRPGADPDQMPILAALEGNIELDLSGSRTIRAVLVALRGSIVNRTPSRSLDLTGGLAVRDLPPESFPQGGRIVFDSLADPTGLMYPLFYRGFISDLPLGPEVLR